MQDWSKRCALVTGASRGIGEAIATRLSQAGAQVILVSRKQEGLDQAADRIAAISGTRPLVQPCHTGRPQAIGALFDALDAQGIRVDALVNNAATNPYFGPMMGLEWAAFDKTFDVNVKGSFEMCRQVAKRLIAAEQGGSIVNVASIYGMMGAPFQGSYAMTKAALISLTQTLAHEWGSAGIRVNAIAPGLVDTQFAAAIVSNPAFAKVFSERSAVNRHGQPQEIAGLVLYLLSGDAGFMTGATVPIDGGYLSG